MGILIGDFPLATLVHLCIEKISIFKTDYFWKFMVESDLNTGKLIRWDKRLKKKPTCKYYSDGFKLAVYSRWPLRQVWLYLAPIILIQKNSCDLEQFDCKIFFNSNYERNLGSFCPFMLYPPTNKVWGGI